MVFVNDYKLTPADSARIKCHCGAQATTGQNNGGAPFWYHCDACAEVERQTGHFYRTGHTPGEEGIRAAQAEAAVRDRIGNTPSCPDCGEQHVESDCEEIPSGAMTEAEKQEYRLDQQDEVRPALIPETPAPTFIDITPESLKTPEGAERVNAAMKTFEESREEVARLATALLKNETILDILRAGLEAQDEHEAIDQLDSLYDAVGVRMGAEEDFVLAVAGKPKRYAATGP